MEKRLGKEPYIGKDSFLENCSYGEFVEIGLGNKIENLSIDDYSYTGEYVFIQNAIVGKFANIAATVRIGATMHPIERATLHHFTYRRSYYGFGYDEEEFFKKREENKVVIGHDTWIGHGAVIMPGVKIGNGAVVGSLAVVTKDVPPYTIVAGVPAKKIGERFTKEVSRKLENIQWWNWSYEDIKKNLNDFYLDINTFLQKHYKEEE